MLMYSDLAAMVLLLHSFDFAVCWCGFGDEALVDFARAELYEVAGTVGEHVDDALGPSDWRCQLGQEV